jgi:hypothetical protein
VATYSLLDVALSISGPNINATIGGDAAGNSEEGFTPSYEEDADVMTQGVNSVMHSLTVAKRGTVELHLLKTSPLNALLSQAYTLDRANGSVNWAKNTITITNPISGDLYVCTSCAFRRFPGNGYQARGNVLVWTFNVGIMDPSLGNLTVQ